MRCLAPSATGASNRTLRCASRSAKQYCHVTEVSELTPTHVLHFCHMSATLEAALSIAWSACSKSFYRCALLSFAVQSMVCLSHSFPFFVLGMLCFVQHGLIVPCKR